MCCSEVQQRLTAALNPNDNKRVVCVYLYEKSLTMQQLQNVIETAFERRADITPANVDTTVTREAVSEVISLPDSGAACREKSTVSGSAHQWLKESGSALFPY